MPNNNNNNKRTLMSRRLFVQTSANVAGRYRDRNERDTVTHQLKNNNNNKNQGFNIGAIL